MISVVIIAKNEEKNIEACLKSVSWCDEIIVIDDNSSDKTAELVKKAGATVFIHSLGDDFSSQRNFGLAKAKNDWILFIDADERISPALWYEIITVTNDPIGTYNGYYLKRNDVIWGKELHHGEVGNITLLRLAKKHTGRWKGNVHETWDVGGKTQILQNPLMHYPHQTVKEFLEEINYYTDLRVQELYKKKVKVSWWSVLLYFKAKFILNYVIRGGFLDGLPGLVFAFMMSFHSFLVRGKLWLLWQQKSQKI